MTNKKDKYFAVSVGINSDIDIFLILLNGVSVNISPDQFLSLKKKFKRIGEQREKN